MGECPVALGIPDSIFIYPSIYLFAFFILLYLLLDSVILLCFMLFIYLFNYVIANLSAYLSVFATIGCYVLFLFSKSACTNLAVFPWKHRLLLRFPIS